MYLYNFDLQKKLAEKRNIKVITGLSNFNIKDIIKKVRAAELGGATYVDVAAHPDIVLAIRSLTNLPICVSSINPVLLYKCALAGAHLVEIGNFDAFYKKNIVFSTKQILDLAKETKLLLSNTPICITIPHTLLLNEQIKLAVQLQKIGINMIQTEGSSAKNRILPINKSKIFKSIYKASSALSSSYALANHLDIPVIASSGIDSLSAPIAISYGASCVGIGSALNNFQTIDSMAHYINEIIYSVGYSNVNSKLSLEDNKCFNSYYTKCFYVKV